MIGVKVANVLSNNRSTRSCYCCNLFQTNFNNPELVFNSSLNLTPTATNFGLSPLHALMRSMDLFLRLSYKLSIKKYAARGDEEKKLVAEKKKRVQSAFWDRLNLVIDIPRVGSGTSNTGNVTRKFFENYKISADILGVDERLIHRMGVVLEVVNDPIQLS